MNLAVRFYSDALPDENPDGIPAIWPVEVIELGSGTTLPEGPYTLMTLEEYNDYRAAHQEEYDAWEAAHQPPPVIPGDDI